MSDDRGPANGQRRPTFAVIGVGPVGGMLSAHLAQAGYSVAVADIDGPHIEAIRRDGIDVMGVREARGKPDRCVTRAADLAGGDYDYVVVATKAAVLQSILPEVATVAANRAFVVSFQNGLDTEAAVAGQVGPDRTLRGVVNYAGGRVAPGRFRMTFFTGHNMVGALSLVGEAAARRYAEVLTIAKLETDYTGEIKKWEWEKTILNAAMSPLCGLTGLTMREVTEWPAMMEIVERLIDEGIAVARVDGFEWDPGFRDHCLDYLRKAGYHRPSLWADLVAGLKTEIGFLNGRIADIGDDRGLPAPTHRVVTTLIEGIERSWVSEHRTKG